MVVGGCSGGKVQSDSWNNCTSKSLKPVGPRFQGGQGSDKMGSDKMASEDEDEGLEFSQTEVAPGVINFAVGTPGASLIPKQDLDAAFAAALAANHDPLIYQYAKIEGTLAFRQSLADFLNAHGCPSPVFRMQLWARFDASISRWIYRCISFAEVDEIGVAFLA